MNCLRDVCPVILTQCSCFCGRNGVNPTATNSTKPAKVDNGNSHAPKFAMVLDGRKNPIRGL